MKHFWGKENYSFDEVRAESYLFANSCFELVKKMEEDGLGFDGIEIMSHAPKILRIIDSIKIETDWKKFRSGLQGAKTEVQLSILGLFNVFRNSDYKTEIENLVSIGQRLQDTYNDLMQLRMNQ